ncbi:hypothetical protein [Collimonas arenae]|uniref:hypothetical protein n=1 Tax=Collimonas arenae TaxID=279058 RepID=UPI00056DED53|nr:hypothetical protein [Collimonas arenae]
MMRAEKTQKGNPHKLTVNQHIFPRASMDRFATSGGVHVRRLDHSDNIMFGTDNPYFCARRVWDHKTEHGLMVEIENKYQDTAEQIASGSVRTLSTHMNESVTDLYLIWQLRFNRYLNPISDTLLKGVEPDRNLSKNSQEVLESKGVVFMKPEGTVPGRFMAGIGISIAMDRERNRMKKTKWGILTSDDVEFIVPDNFLRYSIVPLSPTVCLAAEMRDQRVGVEQVATINGLAIQGSHRYYFARDLSQCPVIRPIPLNLRAYFLSQR